jgi:hypothetical protein
LRIAANALRWGALISAAGGRPRFRGPDLSLVFFVVTR